MLLVHIQLLVFSQCAIVFCIVLNILKEDMDLFLHFVNEILNLKDNTFQDLFIDIFGSPRLQVFFKGIKTMIYCFCFVTKCPEVVPKSEGYIWLTSR